MALLRDVVYKRAPTLKKLIKLQQELVNLKPLKKLVIKFDPFNDNVKSIRDFSFLIHEEDVLQTNPKCIVKTEIATDRSESTVTFNLVNGHDIIFKCDNLSCLEIFKLVNKYITPLAPKEEIEQVAEKKGGKKIK